MATPLFVLGRQRSGTTWLANQLCQHPEIAGALDERHKGIHESAYFSHVAGRFGPLEVANNYIEFVEVMSQTDTMRILGVSKAFLYSLWPISYEGVFKAAMDHHARALGARYWLDKSPDHTVLAHKIATYYPEAKFIGISRNPSDTVRSTVGRYTKGKRAWRRQVYITRTALGLQRHKRHIERFAKRSPNVYVTTYETLKANPEKVYREICGFLGLEFDPGMLRRAYAPNTTFGNHKSRADVLSRRELQLVQWTHTLARLVPLPLIDALQQGHAKRPTLPKGFFRMHPLLQASPLLEEHQAKSFDEASDTSDTSAPVKDEA